jgi:hypothetical protein
MNQNVPYVQGPAPVMLPHNSTMALVSLISGIAGWTIVPFIGAIVAVITGHMAKNEIKRGGGMITGNGMATWGLILGYVNIALGLCVICLLVLSFAGLITIPFINTSNY